ncbi:PA14 domain-containing protein [Flavivirga amylovorans]|uniref:PA14 domain-containing protein n=1 Tax=Flavivirga amylovorans TaxID=870486 RepID=A0ABT8WWJ5_9FLAO|nr:PA14 domain-containing protein [Flavivirga amylovorans]MDO5986056.1 PA14 domain-containing protein [Flavivirga amylovorans]
MNKTSYLALLLFGSYYGSAQVGIGTTNPQAKLDVSGGNVRFSNYGIGNVTGTESYFLGVESDGDIVETSLNKTGLQYYTWDITAVTSPNINNKRSLGVSASQGLLTGGLNDAARAAIVPAPDNDGYITLYTGILRVNNTGVFTFNARSNDGTRIYIDDTLVVDNWTDNPPPLVTVSSSITLTQGDHKVEFWYYENTLTEFMEFTWGANPDSYPVGSVINANQFIIK